MALIVRQTSLCDRCNPAFTVKKQLSSKVVKLKCFVDFQLVGQSKRLATWKHRGWPIIFPKEEPFKMSLFRSNGQNDGEDEKNGESNFSKKPVQLSHEPHERGTLVVSSDTASNSFSIPGNRENLLSRSQTVERLFRKWLAILRIQASSEATEYVHNKKMVGGETSEKQVEVPGGKVDTVLKVACIWFMELDAPIKIPLLIFIPWYVITRVVYGTEVAKELMPLWVLGPLITAGYIKVIQRVSSLYIFCFKQAVRILKHGPCYYELIYNHVREGKLKASLYAGFCQPVVDIKNMDYEALLRVKLVQFNEWIAEKYLDLVEFIWPLYCSTIRFLKKANLL